MKRVMIVVVILFTLLATATYAATYGHTAPQITSGEFDSGDYTFPDRVGIGTTSPHSALVVSTNVTPAATTVDEVADYSGSMILQSNAASANNDKMPLIFSLGGSAPHVSSVIEAGRESTGWRTYLAFFTNSVTSGPQGTDAIQEKMRITSDGNVGIGTTSPVQSLQITGKSLDQLSLNSDGANNAKAYFAMYDGGTAINSYWSINRRISDGVFDDAGLPAATIALNGVTGDSNILFYTASANNVTPIARMKIDKSGNVGIGTASPNEKLTVAGNINATGLICDSNGCIGSGGAGGTAGIWTNSSNNATYMAGNVGIGTTSPKKELDLRGELLLGNVALLEASGVDNSISIGSAGDFRIGKLNWSANGGDVDSDRFVVKSTGNVGIGTATPTLTAHIVGTYGWPNSAGTSQNGSLRVGQLAGGGVIDFGFGDDGSNPGGWVQVANAGDLSAEYNLYLNPNGGKVGIATTLPNEALSVSGNINATGLICDSNGCIGSGSGSGEGIWTNSSNNATYMAGNVGIGTVSPNARLAVFGNITINNAMNDLIFSRYYNNDHTNSPRNYSKIIWSLGDTNGQAYAGIQFHRTPGTGGGITSGAALSFHTSKDTYAPYGRESFYERMRIDNEGNVGIGTTSPTHPLEVGGAIKANNPVGWSTFIDGEDYGVQIEGGNSTSNFALKVRGQNTAEFFYVRGDGNVGIGTTSPTEKLDINGSIRIGTTSSSNAGTMRFVSSQGQFQGYNGSDWVVLGGNATAGGTSGWTDSNGYVYLQTAADDVGIGTATPGAKLHVYDAVTNGGMGPIRIERPDGGYEDSIAFMTGGSLDWVIGQDDISGVGNETDFTIWAGGAVAPFVTVKQSGNVGIGTALPSANYQLNVYSPNTGAAYFVGNTSGSTVAIINERRNTDYSERASIAMGVDRVSPGVTGMVNIQAAQDDTGSPSLAAGKFIVQVRNLSEEYPDSFVIDSSGQVGIGVSDPGAALHIEGAGAGSNIMINETSSGADPNLIMKTPEIQWNVGIENTGDYFIIKDNTNSVDAFIIQNGTGNVGIGTSSPSNFNKALEVYGSQSAVISNTVNGFTEIVAQNGSYSSLIFKNSSSFNIISATATNGANANFLMSINGSTGNVGIGTTSPSVALEVGSTGAINVVEPGGSPAGSFVQIASPSGNPGMIIYDGTRRWDLWNKNGKFSIRDASASERLTIDGSGNIGIGTTSPEGILDLRQANDGADTRVTIANDAAGNSTDETARILFRHNTVGAGSIEVGRESNYSITEYRDSYMRLTTQKDGLGVEVMRLTSEGNVGIGTTDPDPGIDLHIYDAAGHPSIKLETNNSGFSPYIDFKDHNHTWELGANYAGGGNFYLAEQGEGVRIIIQNHTGNVGIGTTSPDISSNDDVVVTIFGGTGANDKGGIELAGSTTTGDQAVGTVAFTNDDSGDSDKRLGVIQGISDTSDYTAGELAFFTNNGSNLVRRMTVDKDGNVGIGSSSPRGKLDIEQDGGIVRTKVVHLGSVSGNQSIDTIANVTNGRPTMVEISGIGRNADSVTKSFKWICTIHDNGALTGVGSSVYDQSSLMSGCLVSGGDLYVMDLTLSNWVITYESTIFDV